MRKILFIVMALFLLMSITFTTVSCFDKKPAAADSVAVDSVIKDTTAADTMTNIIEESPMSKTADELFDDFFFNFAANKKLQFKRILFPLPVIKGGKQIATIAKKQWKMDYFFMKQGYFTLIFDRLKQMDIVKDTSVSKVTIEKIMFANKTIKQYKFERLKGEFMLTSIEYQPINKSVNGEFLKFYQRFSVDSVFQIKSMNETVEFSAPDSDDDFGAITGAIVPEQWPGFKPPIIPHGTVYCIWYGQKLVPGNQKLFVVRGIATDLEIMMVFKRKGKTWKLMKFNT